MSPAARAADETHAPMANERKAGRLRRGHHMVHTLRQGDRGELIHAVYHTGNPAVPGASFLVPGWVPGSTFRVGFQVSGSTFRVGFPVPRARNEALPGLEPAHGTWNLERRTATRPVLFVLRRCRNVLGEQRGQLGGMRQTLTRAGRAALERGHGVRHTQQHVDLTGSVLQQGCDEPASKCVPGARRVHARDRKCGRANLASLASREASARTERDARERGAQFGVEPLEGTASLR